MSYQERVLKIYEALKRKNLDFPEQKSVRNNRNFHKERREGDYLIKGCKNSYIYSDGYLGFDSFLGYGLVFNRRSEAAWIKREEIPELAALLNGFKGLQLVKLSKNKK